MFLKLFVVLATIVTVAEVTDIRQLVNDFSKHEHIAITALDYAWLMAAKMVWI